MQNLFFNVVDLSIAGGIVVLVILLTRLFLRKAPKKWSYLLWSAAALRLCCPVRIRTRLSIFGLFNSGAAAEAEHATVISSHASVVTEAGAEVAEAAGGAAQQAGALSGASAPAAVSAFNINTLFTVLAFIWLLGCAAMLLYGIVSCVRLNRRLASAVRCGNCVYSSEHVRSPFVMGFFTPIIYVPSGLDPNTMEYALAHERCHIRRGDHIIKAFAWLLLSAHWFNPLCWLAFFLMSRDMEMSCDEAVLASGGNIRKNYSRALLDLAVGSRFPAPEPLSFGENAVRSRIKNVMSWKKPKLFISLLAAMLCVTVITACATDPKRPEEQADTPTEEAFVYPTAAAETPEPAMPTEPMPAETEHYEYIVTDSGLSKVEISYISSGSGSMSFGTAYAERDVWYANFVGNMQTKYSTFVNAVKKLLAGSDASRELRGLRGAGPACGSVYFKLESSQLSVYQDAETVYYVVISRDGKGNTTGWTSVSPGGAGDPELRYSNKLTTLPRELGEAAFLRLSELAEAEDKVDIRLGVDTPVNGYLGDGFAVFMLRLGDRTACCMYRTDDGKTWYEFCAPAVYARQMTGVCILSENEAYICFNSSNFRTPIVRRTADCGETWQDVRLPLPSQYPLHMAYSPVFEGGHGVMLLHGSGGDYPDGFTGWVETFDGGETWEFKTSD